MPTEEISLQKIGPVAEQTAATFTSRLLELDPTLREFFHGDIAAQGRNLLQMLGRAVQGVERFEALAPWARQFGRRHARFHVRQSHYETVGEALFWTLAKRWGADFTPEISMAWGKTYWLLAETMKAGARDGAASLKRAAA